MKPTYCENEGEKCYVERKDIHRALRIVVENVERVENEHWHDLEKIFVLV